MAFKTVDAYNEERYGGMFRLQNDRDYADVVFLYRSTNDVLVADTHYIKSESYTGYVHCCGKGCPACAKGIRVQPKLFIPMYVINEDRILFFDRSIRFDAQLQNDVFSKYPNPSEYVFRITRHGSFGDVNTTYEIVAVGRNTFATYDQILAKFHASMPEYYSTICRDVPAYELSSMLSNGTTSSEYSSMPSYQVSPRNVVSSDQAPISIPEELDQAPVLPQPEAVVSEVDYNAEFSEDSDDEDIPF